MADLAVPMPAGKFLGSDGQKPVDLWAPGSAVVDDHADRAYTGDGATTPETIMTNGGAAWTGALPAFAHANDTFDIRVTMDIFNNSGGALTERTRLYWGASVFLDLTVSQNANAAARIAIIDARMILLSSSQMKITGWTAGYPAANAATGNFAGGVGAANGSALNAVGGWATFDGTTQSLTTTSAGDFKLTSTHSSSSALMRTTLRSCQIRYYPKNY